MKKSVEGNFYSWFYDETIEDAVSDHAGSGFPSIDETIRDSIFNNPGKDFRVVDHNLNVVFDSKAQSIEFMISKAKMHAGKFYVQFNGESLVDAVRNHSFGYDSLEDALSDTQANGESGDNFKVYNSNVECVYEGEIMDGRINQKKQ